jgi:hypothetical protein
MENVLFETRENRYTTSEIIKMVEKEKKIEESKELSNELKEIFEKDDHIEFKKNYKKFKENYNYLLHYATQFESENILLYLFEIEKNELFLKVLFFKNNLKLKK